MNIVYWSDFACPYCYIGETRLKKAIKELTEEGSLNEPVTLQMRAFRLDPDAKALPESDTVTRFAKKYRMSPMLAAHQVEKISSLGQREGLEFNYAGTKSTNTADAHRLVKLAYTKDHDTAEKVIEALFKAYFADNLILSDRDILTEIGVQNGLEESKIREMFDSYMYAQEVIEDEKAAYAKGVTGVPYFEINDKQVYGTGQKEHFKRYIMEAAPEVSESNTHICGPDGCKL